MFLARITGHVVATQKDKSLNGQKLFVVEPLNVKYDGESKPASLGNTGRAIVAIDTVGTGEGQLVLVVQGSSADDRSDQDAAGRCGDHRHRRFGRI